MPPSKKPTDGEIADEAHVYNALRADVLEDNDPDEEQKKPDAKIVAWSEDSSIPYVFYDFRHGPARWPKGVQLVDEERGAQLIKKAKADAVAAAEKKRQEINSQNDKDPKDPKKACVLKRDEKTTIPGKPDEVDDLEQTTNAPDGATYETLSDGSFALIIPPGTRLQLDVQAINDGGDARKEEREREEAARRELKRRWKANGWGFGKTTWEQPDPRPRTSALQEYTVVMDVKLVDKPPPKGVALFQTALVRVEENEKDGTTRISESQGEAVIAPTGGVGTFGNFGDVMVSAVKKDRWHRITISVKCGNGKEKKGEMLTWTDARSGAVVKSEHIQTGSRFSMDPASLFLFSSSDPNMMARTFAVRTVCVIKKATHDAEVRKNLAKDRCLSMYNVLRQQALVEQRAALSLAPLFGNNARPMWNTAAMIGTFGDPFGGEAMVADRASLAWCYRVFRFILKRLLEDEAAGPFCGGLFASPAAEPTRKALSGVYLAVERSEPVFAEVLRIRTNRLLLDFLRRLRAHLSALPQGEQLLLPLRVEGHDVLLLVSHTVERKFDFVVISTDPDSALKYHAVNPAVEPSKIMFRTCLVLPSIPRKRALDDAFWMGVYNMYLSCQKGDLRKFYDVLLPFLTDKPLELSLIESEAPENLNLSGAWRSPQRSSTAYVRTIFHALSYILTSHSGVSALRAKQVGLALRVEMLQMLRHDMQAYPPDRNATTIARFALHQVAHRALKLSKALADERDGGGCAICLGPCTDERKTRTLGCGHRFHDDCVAALGDGGAPGCVACSTDGSFTEYVGKVQELLSGIGSFLQVFEGEDAAPPPLDLSLPGQWFCHALGWQVEQVQPDRGAITPLLQFEPIDLLQIPKRAATREECIHALRMADKLATRLENEQHCVKNHKFLIASLLEHVFLRVLPVPRPREYAKSEADAHRAARSERRRARQAKTNEPQPEGVEEKGADEMPVAVEAADESGVEEVVEELDLQPGLDAEAKACAEECVWDEDITYELQVELLLVLQRLAEHFAAASASIEPTRPFDAVRIVVLGCACAISDSLLRRRATNHPSEGTAHLTGRDVEGRQLGLEGFGISAEGFATQTETMECHTPELLAARCAILDYFDSPAQRRLEKIFSWESNFSRIPSRPLIKWLRMIAREIALPTSNPHLLLCDSHPESSVILKNYPELRPFRDIVFWWKYFLNPDMANFPPIQGSVSRIKAQISFQWDGGEYTVGCGFDGDMRCHPIPCKKNGRFLQAHELPRTRYPSIATPSFFVPAPELQTEDDAIYRPSLPNFQDENAQEPGPCLGQRDAELLISYLTVPYLRLPLVVRFFAVEDRVHKLASSKLRNILDSVLFEPGRFAALRATAVEPRTVPTQHEFLLGCPYGMLLNDLHRSPEVTCDAINALLDAAIALDTGSVCDPGKNDFNTSVMIILYICRLASRVLSYVHFCIARVEHPDNCVDNPVRDTPPSPESVQTLHAAMNEFSSKLSGPFLGLLDDYLNRLHNEIEADSKNEHLVNRNTKLACDLHGHRLLILRTFGAAGAAKVMDASTANAIMSSFTFLTCRHTWNMGTRTDGKLLMPETELYEILTFQRRRLIQYAVSLKQTRLNAVMQGVLRVATSTTGQFQQKFDDATVNSIHWGRLPGVRSIGRFKVAAAGPKVVFNNDQQLICQRSEDDDGIFGMEINLQLGQMTIRSKHLEALDTAISSKPDMLMVFGPSTLQASLLEMAQHCRRYHLVGLQHNIEYWPKPHERCPPLGLEWERSYDPAELFESEAWIPPLFEPVRQAFYVQRSPADPPTLQWLMVESALPDTAQVAVLLGLHPLLGGPYKLVILFRHYNCVHVYECVSHARRWWFTLHLTTDYRYCNSFLQPCTSDRACPPPAWWARGAGSPYPTGLVAHLKTSIQGGTSSISIEREATHEANLSGGRETLVPTRLLHGLIPDALLETHRFWQDETPSGRYNRLRLRGYPEEEADDTLLLVDMYHSEAMAITGFQERVVRVMRMSLAKAERRFRKVQRVVSKVEELRLLRVRPKDSHEPRDNEPSVTYKKGEVVETLVSGTDAAKLANEQDTWAPCLVLCCNSDGTYDLQCSGDWSWVGTVRSADPSKMRYKPKEQDSPWVFDGLSDSEDEAWQSDDSQDDDRRHDEEQISWSINFEQLACIESVLEASNDDVDVCEAALIALVREGKGPFFTAIELADALKEQIVSVQVECTSTEARGIPEEEKMLLLSLLYAPHGSRLFSLAKTLCRIETLSHILVWTKDVKMANEEYSIDVVELPRLKLTFTARVDRDGEVKLFSMDHSDVCISNERHNDALTKGLFSCIPHSLLLNNGDGEFQLLVPVLPPVRPRVLSHPFGTDLVIDRTNSVWNAALRQRFYLYPLHVSSSFVLTKGVNTALYLLLLRWLHRDYEAAYRLCDSIATDSKLPGEAGQIFQAFRYANDDQVPDSVAVRLKISSVTLDSGTQFPWSLLEQLAEYVVKIRHVSASCRLPFHEELQLLESVAHILKVTPLTYHMAMVQNRLLCLRSRLNSGPRALEVQCFAPPREVTGTWPCYQDNTIFGELYNSEVEINSREEWDAVVDVQDPLRCECAPQGGWLTVAFMHVLWSSESRKTLPSLKEIAPMYPSVSFLLVGADKRGLDTIAKGLGVEKFPTVVFLRGNNEIAGSRIVPGGDKQSDTFVEDLQETLNDMVGDADQAAYAHLLARRRKAKGEVEVENDAGEDDTVWTWDAETSAQNIRIADGGLTATIVDDDYLSEATTWEYQEGGLWRWIQVPEDIENELERLFLDGFFFRNTKLVLRKGFWSETLRLKWTREKLTFSSWFVGTFEGCWGNSDQTVSIRRRGERVRIAGEQRCLSRRQLEDDKRMLEWQQRAKAARAQHRRGKAGGAGGVLGTVGVSPGTGIHKWSFRWDHEPAISGKGDAVALSAATSDIDAANTTPWFGGAQDSGSLALFASGELYHKGAVLDSVSRPTPRTQLHEILRKAPSEESEEGVAAQQGCGAKKFEDTQAQDEDDGAALPVSGTVAQSSTPGLDPTIAVESMAAAAPTEDGPESCSKKLDREPEVKAEVSQPQHTPAPLWGFGSTVTLVLDTNQSGGALSFEVDQEALSLKVQNVFALLGGEDLFPGVCMHPLDNSALDNSALAADQLPSTATTGLQTQWQTGLGTTQEPGDREMNFEQDSFDYGVGLDIGCKVEGRYKGSQWRKAVITEKVESMYNVTWDDGYTDDQVKDVQDLVLLRQDEGDDANAANADKDEDEEKSALERMMRELARMTMFSEEQIASMPVSERQELLVKAQAARRIIQRPRVIIITAQPVESAYMKEMGADDHTDQTPEQGDEDQDANAPALTDDHFPIDRVRWMIRITKTAPWTEHLSVELETARRAGKTELVVRGPNSSLIKYHVKPGGRLFARAADGSGAECPLRRACVPEGLPGKWEVLSCRYEPPNSINGEQGLEAFQKLWSGEEDTFGLAHGLGFLFVYSLLRGQTRIKLHTTGGWGAKGGKASAIFDDVSNFETGYGMDGGFGHNGQRAPAKSSSFEGSRGTDSHRFGLLMANLLADRSVKSICSSVLNVLGRNKHLCVRVPEFIDTRKEKSSKIFNGWTDASEPRSPIADLFRKLVPLLQKLKRSTRCNLRFPPPPPHPQLGAPASTTCSTEFFEDEHVLLQEPPDLACSQRSLKPVTLEMVEELVKPVFSSLFQELNKLQPPVQVEDSAHLRSLVSASPDTVFIVEFHAPGSGLMHPPAPQIRHVCSRMSWLNFRCIRANAALCETAASRLGVRSLPTTMCLQGGVEKQHLRASIVGRKADELEGIVSRMCAVGGRSELEEALFSQVTASIAATAEDVLELSTLPLASLQRYVRQESRMQQGLPAIQPSLAFDVSTHPSANTAVAKSMLTRIEDDMAAHAEVANRQPKPKLVFLSDGLMLGHVEGDAAATEKVQAAIQDVEEMVLRLQQLQQRDTEAIDYTITLTHVLAKQVDLTATAGGSDHASRVQFLLQRVAGHVTRPGIEFLLGTVLSSCGMEDVKRANPFLPEDRVAAMLQLISLAMLRANRVGHINRCIAAAWTMKKLLLRFMAVDAKTVLAPEIVQAGEVLAENLSGRRHFMKQEDSGGAASFDPRFEFVWNIILRKQQVETVQDFVAVVKGGGSKVKQMLMGAGKTKVVAPLMVLMLADGKSLLLSVVPKALLEMSRTQMRETFANVMTKRVYTLAFERSTEIRPQMQSALANAARNRGVVVTTPASMKSLMLRYIEILRQLDELNREEGQRAAGRERAEALGKEAEELAGILRLFQGGVMLLDEVDLLLHPLKSELNFPMGEKHDLDCSESGERWTLPMHIFDGLFFATTGNACNSTFEEGGVTLDILRRIRAMLARGFDIRALQRLPHCTLLNIQWYHEHLKPVLAEWIYAWVQQQHVHGVSREEALGYMLEGGMARSEVAGGLAAVEAALATEPVTATDPVANLLDQELREVQTLLSVQQKHFDELYELDGKAESASQAGAARMAQIQQEIAMVQRQITEIETPHDDSFDNQYVLLASSVFSETYSDPKALGGDVLALHSLASKCEEAGFVVRRCGSWEEAVEQASRLRSKGLLRCVVAGGTAVKACKSTCRSSHDSDGDCVVCGKNWYAHNGHTCHNGQRGAWSLKQLGTGRSIDYLALAMTLMEEQPKSNDASVPHTRVAMFAHAGGLKEEARLALWKADVSVTDEVETLLEWVKAQPAWSQAGSDGEEVEGGGDAEEKPVLVRREMSAGWQELKRLRAQLNTLEGTLEAAQEAEECVLAPLRARMADAHRALAEGVQAHLSAMEESLRLVAPQLLPTEEESDPVGPTACRDAARAMAWLKAHHDNAKHPDVDALHSKAEVHRAVAAVRAGHKWLSQALLASKVMAHVAAPLHKKLLNLCHNWLRTYIPHCLAKINRVSFGLLSDAECEAALLEDPCVPRSRLKLAVPFIGKDVPSRSSEFAHPDVIIGLTVLAYRYSGMRYEDFADVIDHLCSEFSLETGPARDRPSSKLFEEWVLRAGGKIRGVKTRKPKLSRSSTQGTSFSSANTSFESQEVESDTSAPVEVVQLKFFQRSNREQMETLFGLWRAEPLAIHHYLCKHIFPEYMRSQRIRISASGQAVGGEMLVGRRIGFSGTPSDLLPKELGRCDYSRGDDGKMLSTLLNPSVASHEMLPDDWTVHSILKRIALAESPRYHALIDTGALITGLSNMEVAKYLLEQGLKWCDGVVFLDENDEKHVLVRATGRAVPSEQCGIPLERRFAFYDQIHTTGMDIKHVVDAVAVITLGKDMVFRDYAQGAYRMRGIGAGQKIRAYITPEVADLMHRQLLATGGPENVISDQGSDSTLVKVVAWLVINSMVSEQTQWIALCQQNVTNIYRKNAFQKLLRSGREFARGVEDDGSNGSDSVSKLPLRPSLQVFEERIEFALDAAVPDTIPFTERLQGMLEQNQRWILSPEQHAVGAGVLCEVAELPTFNDRDRLDTEQEREQQQEQEKEIQQKQEQQIEIEKFVELEYSRNNEKQRSWPLPLLGVDPQAKNQDQADSHPFYPLRNFGLVNQEALCFPGSMMLSRNYFNPAWKGLRRLKNVIMVCEWAPDSGADSLRLLTAEEHKTSAKLKDAHRECLAKTHALLACHHGDAQERMDRHGVAEVVLAATDIKPTEQLLDQLMAEFGDGQGITLEKLGDLLTTGRLRPEHKGRYWTAVSLAEAETLRRVLHVRTGKRQALLPNANAEMALHISASGAEHGKILDRSYGWMRSGTGASLYETAVANGCFRFFDCDTNYLPPTLTKLVRSLQAADPHDRELFFTTTIGARRRIEKKWHETSLAPLFTIADEWVALKQRAQAAFVRQAVKLKGLSPWEAFTVFDADSNSLLTPAELYGALRWLQVPKLQAEDVVDFFDLADQNGDMIIDYGEYMNLMVPANQHAAIHELEDEDEEAAWEDTELGTKELPAKIEPYGADELREVLIRRRTADLERDRKAQARRAVMDKLRDLQNYRQELKASAERAGGCNPKVLEPGADRLVQYGKEHVAARLVVFSFAANKHPLRTSLSGNFKYLPVLIDDASKKLPPMCCKKGHPLKSCYTIRVCFVCQNYTAVHFGCQNRSGSWCSFACTSCHRLYVQQQTAERSNPEGTGSSHAAVATGPEQRGRAGKQTALHCDPGSEISLFLPPANLAIEVTDRDPAAAFDADVAGMARFSVSLELQLASLPPQGQHAALLRFSPKHATGSHRRFHQASLYVGATGAVGTLPALENLRVQPDSDLDSKAEPSSAAARQRMVAGKWQVLTVAVDSEKGIMQCYINGRDAGYEEGARPEDLKLGQLLTVLGGGKAIQSRGGVVRQVLLHGLFVGPEEAMATYLRSADENLAVGAKLRRLQACWRGRQLRKEMEQRRLEARGTLVFEEDGGTFVAGEPEEGGGGKEEREGRD